MDIVFSRSWLLILAAALAYSFATLGIKMASWSLSPPAVAIIFAGFGLATVAEIHLLRRADLGVIYMTIIAVETIAVLSIAAVIGEGLNLRQSLGAGLVLAGILLVDG